MSHVRSNQRLQEPFEQEWQEHEEWYRGSSARSSVDRPWASQQLRQQLHLRQQQQEQQERQVVQRQQQQEEEEEDSIEEVVRLHQQQLQQAGPVRRRSAGVQVGGGGGSRGFVAAVGGVVGQGFLALRRTRARAGCAS